MFNDIKTLALELAQTSGVIEEKGTEEKEIAISDNEIAVTSEPGFMPGVKSLIAEMNSTNQAPVTENKKSVVPGATTLSDDEPRRQSTTTKQQFVMSPPREPQTVVVGEPDKFAAPVVKLDWEEILNKISIILASAQPVKYFQVEGTGQLSRPLVMANGTESVATFSDWLMAGKDCMAIGKDGIAHWFMCDVKAGTLRYGTTFGCDYT